MDDRLHDNGKVWSLSDKAFRVWVYSISYCNQKRDSDPAGRLTEAEARYLCKFARADWSKQAELRFIGELVAGGFWDKTDDEYRIHDFRKYMAPSEPRERSRIRKAWEAIRGRVAPLILARDGESCRYCGAAEHLEIDHIVPLALGGTNNDSNLAVACRQCNRSKGALTVMEWRG